MKGITLLTVLAASIGSIIYGIVLAILSILFLQLTPFIGGVMFASLGAIALYVYTNEMNQLSKELF